MVLQEGGMGVLSNLIQATASERLRLKALMVCRRMLYEVGSTARMDAEAIQVRARACMHMLTHACESTCVHTKGGGKGEEGGCV